MTGKGWWHVVATRVLGASFPGPRCTFFKYACLNQFFNFDILALSWWSIIEPTPRCVWESKSWNWKCSVSMTSDDLAITGERARSSPTDELPSAFLSSGTLPSLSGGVGGEYHRTTDGHEHVWRWTGSLSRASSTDRRLSWCASVLLLLWLVSSLGFL